MIACETSVRSLAYDRRYTPESAGEADSIVRVCVSAPGMGRPFLSHAFPERTGTVNVTRSPDGTVICCKSSASDALVLFKMIRVSADTLAANSGAKMSSDAILMRTNLSSTSHLSALRSNGKIGDALRGAQEFHRPLFGGSHQSFFRGHKVIVTGQMEPA